MNILGLRVLPKAIQLASSLKNEHISSSIEVRNVAPTYSIFYFNNAKL